MNKSLFTTKQSSKAKPDKDRAPSCGYVYSCFFSALQDYQAGQLTRIEVQVLEYFIGLAEYYARDGYIEFWHSYEDIAEETWLAIETVKKVVTKFKKLGFLSVRMTYPRGQRTSTFSIKYLAIAKKFQVLFGRPGNKPKAQYLRIQQRRVALVRMYLLKQRNQRQQWAAS